MAPRLNWWWVAAAAGCLAVAIGYVPPRGSSARSPFRAADRAATPETRRAMELAIAWRDADLALAMATRRLALAPLIDRRRASDQPTIVTAFEGAFDDASRRRIAALVDTLWRDLGLGTTKIGVGLIVTTPPPRAPGLPRSAWASSPAYHFPDSLDRATCLAMIGFRQPQGRPHLRELEARLRRGLGPCAFYAAFGRPSPTIEAWLAERRYDLAFDPVWDVAHADRHEAWYAEIFAALADRSFVWNWLYQAPPTTVGCLAGRDDACRAYFASGAHPNARRRTTIVTDFERRGPPLPGGTEVLSDMVREFGTPRFARFWIAPLAPDSAFAAAMDSAPGTWLAERQARITPRLPLGPAAPAGATVLGLLLVAGALGVAALMAARRQVG